MLGGNVVKLFDLLKTKVMYNVFINNIGLNECKREILGIDEGI